MSINTSWEARPSRTPFLAPSGQPNCTKTTGTDSLAKQRAQKPAGLNPLIFSMTCASKKHANPPIFVKIGETVRRRNLPISKKQQLFGNFNIP